MKAISIWLLNLVGSLLGAELTLEIPIFCGMFIGIALCSLITVAVIALLGDN